MILFSGLQAILSVAQGLTTRAQRQKGKIYIYIYIQNSYTLFHYLQSPRQFQYLKIGMDGFFSKLVIYGLRKNRSNVG